MRKRTCIIISLWIISALCWAFVFILRYTNRTVFVQSYDFASTPGVRMIDPNAGKFEITRREPERVDVKWLETNIYVKDNGRVKMRENSQNVKVSGKLSNGKSYPVVIDTGYSDFMAVTDSVVIDAGLAIYPMTNWKDKLVGGLCELPSLDLGNITIEQSACEYWLAHYERRVLGLTVWKEMKIILGLGLMKGFSYISIDNINREVEFSAKKPFSPRDVNQWIRHTMMIENNEKANARLMVDIPIAGHSRHIHFDTGAAAGLIMTEKIWSEISPDLKLVDEEKSFMATPLAGLLPCRKITIELLELGGLSIHDAQVNVTANKNPYGQDDFTLGMGFFKETVIVLNFESELLWIMNPVKSAVY